MNPEDFTFSPHTLRAIGTNPRSNSMVFALGKLLDNAHQSGLCVLHVHDTSKAERNRIYVGMARLETADIVRKVRNSVYALNPYHVLHPYYDELALDTWRTANE